MAQIPKEWLKILDLYVKLDSNEQERFASNFTPEQREYLDFIYDQCMAYRMVPIKENHRLHGKPSFTNPLKKISENIAQNAEPGEVSHFKLQMPAAKTASASGFGLFKTIKPVDSINPNNQAEGEVKAENKIETNQISAIKVDMGNTRGVVMPGITKTQIPQVQNQTEIKSLSKNPEFNLAQKPNNFNTAEPSNFHLNTPNPILSQTTSRPIPKQFVQKSQTNMALGSTPSQSNARNKLSSLNSRNLFSKIEYKRQMQKQKLTRMAQIGAASLSLLVIPITAIIMLTRNQNGSVSGAIASFGGGAVSGRDISDTAYNKWMDNILRDKNTNRDKLADPDNDGLTNFEEFQFGSFPDSYSSCGNKRGDGENLLSSIDPVSCKTLNYNDINVTSKYDTVITRQSINDRLTLIALDGFRRKKVAGVSENVQNTDENKVAVINPGTGSLSKGELIDTNQVGELTISKLSETSGIDGIPVQWVSDTSLQSLDKAMQNGVAHYPGTALPTETGTVYISGRSVDTNHPDNKYGNIFSELDKLTADDLIELKVLMQDGTSKKFTYRIKKMNTVKASDSKQFESVAGKKEIVLTTGWPKVSNEQRLILRASLEKVEVIE